MKKIINNTHIEGLVYEHKLEKKIAGQKAKNPGVEFINGTLNIATDDNMMNVIQVHFSYVTPVTAQGKPNATYNVLNSIIEGKIGSIMEHGAENAGKVRVDSAIGLNEWYDSRNNDQLVSIKRNEGGFVHQVTGELCKPDARSTFETDMIINGVRRIEADIEKNTPEKMIVKGAVFSFKGDLLPVEFSVINSEGAMNYFESLDASPNNPIFTKVKGNQISQTVVKQIVEESAFGDASIKEVRNSYKDFVINWAQPDTYEWDIAETMTAKELEEAMAKRELALAELKQRTDEWRASQGNALGESRSAAAPAVKNEKYDF